MKKSKKKRRKIQYLDAEDQPPLEEKLVNLSSILYGYSDLNSEDYVFDILSPDLPKAWVQLIRNGYIAKKKLEFKQLQGCEDVYYSKYEDSASKAYKYQVKAEYNYTDKDDLHSKVFKSEEASLVIDESIKTEKYYDGDGNEITKKEFDDLFEGLADSEEDIDKTERAAIYDLVRDKLKLDKTKRELQKKIRFKYAKTSR